MSRISLSPLVIGSVICLTFWILIWRTSKDGILVSREISLEKWAKHCNISITLLNMVTSNSFSNRITLWSFMTKKRDSCVYQKNKKYKENTHDSIHGTPPLSLSMLQYMSSVMSYWNMESSLIKMFNAWYKPLCPKCISLIK